MKKKLFSMALCIVMALSLLPTAALADDLPNGWWPVFSAYNEAVGSGNAEKIIEKGNALAAFYAKYPRTNSISEQLYNYYYLCMDKQLYENMNNYEGAAENVRKLLEISQWQQNAGYDRLDMIRACQARLSVLTPVSGVYALSYTQSNTYGSKIAAASGTYYGSVNDGAYGSAGIASFYIELEYENARMFDYLIKPKSDGHRVLQINLNFKGEGATARAIPGGTYDTSITETLKYLATLKSPVLLRIGAEMDVWTSQVSPADYIAAYRYIADMARRIAPAVELIWSPNHTSDWDTNVEDYYPGDTYVDWVGVSLYFNYNSNSGTTPTKEWAEYAHLGEYADPIAIAQKVVQLGQKHGKPVAVTEGGCAREDRGDAYAAAQLAKEFSTLTMVYPQVKSIVHFDKDISGNNYLLSGEVKAAADAAIAANPTLIGAGQVSAGTYVPVESFNETTNGTLVLGANGRTCSSIDMSAVYTLDGAQVAATSGSPNTCKLNIAALSDGAHKLDVKLSDGKGYTVTKTYTLTVSGSAATVKSGWTAAAKPVTAVQNTVSNKAYSSTQTVLFNAQKVTLNTFYLTDANGNATNYVSLRDIADLLDGTKAQFNVGWDGEKRLILVDTGKAYTTRNGSEGKPPFHGEKDYTVLDTPVSLCGVSKKVDGIVLRDAAGNGYTYFKLRDLGTLCSFAVGWGQDTGITIDA